ncbi:PREDICTED: testis-specific serine/threonine-protein kinase 6 [Nanorana parkeri]|uniref:testis-specific serine/threonine-protein kinase 6 n=1 Tax=Nanorana parkeri TaxID=125878 RepID=UPI000854B055|nr:PREDICTED: testis-specific serine/threonine-protein kinase 6 [Nanorana parkeri]
MFAVNQLLKDLGYNVVRTIGEGTFSKVKLATSQKYHRDVAIKVVDRREAPEIYSTKLLPRELEILRTVNHPNVIAAYEFIAVSNGLHFIVMELCFTDLLKVIEDNGRLTEAKAKSLFQQIVCAMSYLHHNQIVHRDLKCENILLTEDHKVKITDFNFGKLLDSTDLSTTYCGSVAYASPEVLQGIPYDPKKYDIWSIGVILYMMVIGTFPFDDSNITALPELQEKGVEFPKDLTLDKKYENLIKALLEYSPHQRPDIGAVLVHSWLEEPINQAG